jgi:hypothetical protein
LCSKKNIHAQYAAGAGVLSSLADGLERGSKRIQIAGLKVEREHGVEVIVWRRALGGVLVKA